MTEPFPGQMPLWEPNSRLLIVDPGTEEEQVYSLLDNEGFELKHPEDGRVVLKITPVNE